MMILWKEWRQQRWLFVLGCLAGITVPIFDGVASLRHTETFRSDAGSAVVLSCGGLFAIILAIATTHYDTRKGVDDFWQSRPLKAWKLFTTKFLLAAIVLCAAFMFTLSLDFATHLERNSSAAFAWLAFCYTYPIALLLFSVAMLFVVLLRDSAKAVLLAIWAALLVYFLPLLVPWLGWMNLFEQMEVTRRKSVLQFLIWSLSSAWRQPGAKIFRPVGIPVSVYRLSCWQALWQIVTSPEYLQYLLFLVVAIAASVACVVLSIIAFRRKWRWQPGQKTIAWTVGLSAAFIFCVSMSQAGHNLQLVKIHNGREIVSKISFWVQAENEYNWTGEALGDDEVRRQPHRPEAVCCVQGDLMFRVSTGYQAGKDQKRLDWDTPVKQHFFLDIYRFPYTREGFHLSETRFFATPPIARNRAQYILGCFVRGDRLYVVYRPISPDDKKPATDADVDPIRLLVADVSNPNEPRRISDEEIARPNIWGGGSVACYGRYCYVSDFSELLVLSLANHDKPEIVATVTLPQLGLNAPKLKYFPARQMQIAQGKLICLSASGAQVVMFDLAEPTKPQPIYYGEFEMPRYTYDGKWVGAVAYANGILYVTTQSGIYLYELTPGENGMLRGQMVGRRKATPIERMAGRRTLTRLIVRGNLLIEAANSFGVLVYDVSEPARPRRLFHGETPNYTSDIGIWDGLTYAVNYGTQLIFLDVPNGK